MGTPNKLYAKIKNLSKNNAHNSLLLTEKNNRKGVDHCMIDLINGYYKLVVHLT